MKKLEENKKYHFWILQTGEPIHSDKEGYRPMRLVNLSNFLLSQGHSSTIFTSKFNHLKKDFRKLESNNERFNKKIEYIFLDSIGYSNNVSLERLIDHFSLSFSLIKKLFLYKGKSPDFIFIGFPPIEIAFVMVLYAKLRSIRCILDVKDQWPEIFERAGGKNFLKCILLKILFFPHKMITLFTFKNADMVSTISGRFLQWIYFYSKRKINKKDFIFPLVAKPIKLNQKKITSNLNWLKNNGLFQNDVIKITFVGSLNNNFSFSELKYALDKLDSKKKKYQIIICGDGPKLKELQSLFISNKNVILPGWVSQEKAKTLYELSDLIFAPYINSKDFIDSIPNKIIDAISYGKPILTSLRGEVYGLLNSHKIGFYYKSGEDILEIINKISKDKNLLLDIQKNCRKLYSDKFEFNMVYGEAIKNFFK